MFCWWGHIKTLLRLGKRLLTRGLNVTLATTQLVYHRVFESSFRNHNGIRVLFFSEGLGSGPHHKPVNKDQYMELIGEYGPINLSNTIKDHFLSGSKRLACIINNPFVPWVADVAANFKIPCSCLWIQPCALYSIYYNFHNNLNPFPTPEDPNMSVQLPGLPLPHGFLEETKEQGMIVPWCPQPKVLIHPAKACFLTHCGWNSMLEAITAVIPMIGYPQWTDQPTNAKLISDVFHLGIRLNHGIHGFVATEEVERGIHQIFVGPNSQQFRKIASQLKRAARGAVAHGGSSDRNIQSFVDEILGDKVT